VKIQWTDKNKMLRNYNQSIIIIIIIIKTIIVVGIALYANLRVPTRVNDVVGGAIFSKNSTFLIFYYGSCYGWMLHSEA